MTDEDRQRTMDFILEQQGQSSINLYHDAYCQAVQL
jgi:hypothetical protein